MNARHPLLSLCGVLAVCCLIASACTGAAEQSDGVSDATEPTVLGTTTEPAEDTTTTDTPPALSGTLRITGSNTVQGITDAVAAGYAGRQPNVTIATTSEGSSSGFSDLCTDPDVNLVGSSRAISGTESATCLANGVLPIELRLARDGIAVIANNAADFQCLTYTDLYALAGPESTGLTTRQAVGAFAAELGSTTAWGTGDLHVVAPGPVHATHQLLVDFALEPIAQSRGVGTFMRVDNRSLDSDQQLVEAVAADPAAIGFVGSSFAVRNSNVVKLVGVSDGSGCVLPNDAAVVQGFYPMSRDLFLYANGAAQDPILDDFLFYYLDINLTEAVTAAEYVPLSAVEQAETAARWQNR